jgi:hypothetical protein
MRYGIGVALKGLVLGLGVHQDFLILQSKQRKEFGTRYWACRATVGLMFSDWQKGQWSVFQVISFPTRCER